MVKNSLHADTGVLSRRASGILLSITSLPAPHGVGDIGRPAHDFIDFLHQGGQKFWQILPTGPTSPIFGNSPYMSCSAFAGNPLLISPEMLAEQNLLLSSELSPPSFSEYTVDYEKAAAWKQHLLDLAWQRFQANGYRATLDNFRRAHDWVDAYGLFLALKEEHGGQAWFTWPREIRFRKEKALADARMRLARRIDRFVFEQYVFFRQWRQLRNKAQKKQVHLIGDLPIYVGLDSVDAWANQDIFDLNRKTGRPNNVAGVPPDYFSKTGQRWGNPLYRWNSRSKEIKQNLWNWWEQRLNHSLSLCDAVRIDHFRGFESYWSVPASQKTALKGTWKKGPGKPFFQEMERRIGKLPIIAEDLGIITPAVEKLRDDLGYPGMKILLFAFDGRPENSYLPHNLPENCVIYSGTHDNDTAVGWFLSPEVSEDAKRQAKQQANQMDNEVSTFHRDMLYLAFSSVARLAILPMQDLLGFGNDCRLNTPGTTEGNWQWRCAPRFITGELADSLRETTRFFARLDEQPDNTDHADSDT